MRQRRQGWGRPETAVVFCLLTVAAVLCAALVLVEVAPWVAGGVAVVFLGAAAVGVAFLRQRDRQPPEDRPDDPDSGEFPRLAS